MKHLNIKYLAIVFTAITLLSSCSSLRKINREYDKTVDFDQYNSFIFFAWDNKNNMLINKNDREMLTYSIENELDDRGISLSKTSGDLIVDIYVTMLDKVSKAAYSNYYQTGYWNTFSMGAFGYSTFNFYQKEFTQATLVVNIFDMKAKKLVWSGSGTAKISDDETEREKGIPEAIKHLFDKFPKKKVKK